MPHAGLLDEIAILLTDRAALKAYLASPDNYSVSSPMTERDLELFRSILPDALEKQSRGLLHKREELLEGFFPTASKLDGVHQALWSYVATVPSETPSARQDAAAFVRYFRTASMSSSALSLATDLVEYDFHKADLRLSNAAYSTATEPGRNDHVHPSTDRLVLSPSTRVMKTSFFPFSEKVRDFDANGRLETTTLRPGFLALTRLRDPCRIRLTDLPADLGPLLDLVESSPQLLQLSTEVRSVALSLVATGVLRTEVG